MACITTEVEIDFSDMLQSAHISEKQEMFEELLNVPNIAADETLQLFLNGYNHHWRLSLEDEQTLFTILKKII